MGQMSSIDSVARRMIRRVRCPRLMPWRPAGNNNMAAAAGGGIRRVWPTSAHTVRRRRRRRRSAGVEKRGRRRPTMARLTRRQRRSRRGRRAMPTRPGPPAAPLNRPPGRPLTRGVAADRRCVTELDVLPTCYLRRTRQPNQHTHTYTNTHTHTHTVASLATSRRHTSDDVLRALKRLTRAV